MQTSDLILRQVRRAFAAAFLLGGCAAVLQFAIPLFALHALDSAIPSRNFDTILLLAALAAAALVTLAVLDSMRTRILLRAGLWLEHILGCELIEAGVQAKRPPALLAEDAAALATLRRSTTEGTLLAAFDAPWQVLLLAGVALLDWRMAAIGAVPATLLVARLWLSRAAVEQAVVATARAADRTAAWWHALVRRKDGPLPSAVSIEWERLSRDHVASAYELFSATSISADLARFLRTAAQVATLTLGAWLVIEGELTRGAVVAALLLLWRSLEPLERLVASMPDLGAARLAWARLSSRETGRAVPHDRTASAVPALRIGGPLTAALVAVAAFFSIVIGVTATTRIGALVAASGKPLFDARLTSVFPARKGIGGQVYVKEGALVARGDLIATLDTRLLDTRIAALKLKSATAAIELGSLRQELATQATPAAGKSREALDKLQQRIGDLGRQGRDLAAAIAAAEEELAQSRITAPAAGRIVTVDIRPGMPVETDAPLATLVTSDDTLLHRLIAPLVTSSWGDRIASALHLANASGRGKG